MLGMRPPSTRTSDVRPRLSSSERVRPCLWQEDPARRGERDALAAAFEQLGTQLLLQCLNPL
jgi:hypothetical protein